MQQLLDRLERVLRRQRRANYETMLALKPVSEMNVFELFALVQTYEPEMVE